MKQPASTHVAIRQKPLRLKVHRHQRDYPVFELPESLSRQQALRQVASWLSREERRFSNQHTQALRLIELFNLDAEELSEAGVAYEVLRSLEQRCITLRSALL